MSSKIRNVALLLPAFVLATGLASAQPGVKVSTVNSDGTVTTTTITTGSANGPAAKAPTAAADGSAKYWDGLGLGGASTNYFTQVPYITAPPNPQIATGPDDILTIVNRTISRYPNPNAAGNTGTLNPYNYPPTEFVPLDVWMGLTVLGAQAGGGALCPSGTGSNSTCVIDNASIRYDQLQGRFLVLFTVTDLPAHRSNWVLLVSTFAQFQKCPSPPTGVCPTSSPLFTPPVIAPIVGGTQTGGQNSQNWVLYAVPINLLYNPFQQPSALGLINNPAGLVPPFNNPLANSAVGTPNSVTSGGSTGTFLTTPFCANGGPLLPLTYATVNGQALGAGGTGRSCTNYYPTGARFGIDNDNIILTAPVLDQAFAPNEGSFPSGAGQVQGAYAGTRVTTIAKLVIYNGTKLNFSQPGPGGCDHDSPVDCQAVNLSDDTATGTLTEITQKIAFGQGTAAVLGTSAAGDLRYGSGGATVPGFSPLTPNSCITANPVAVPPTPLPANAVVLSCAPTAALRTALPAIFWEPDNLRGRSLASFDAQVAPFTTVVAGVITPIDYLVGTEITDNFGAGIKPQGVPGVTGQPGPVPGTIVPATAGIATIYYVQSIAFSCPGVSGLESDFSDCFSGSPGGQSVVADLPFLGPLSRNASTLAQVADPAPVGQGFSAAQMTTNPLNTPVSPTTNSRIFVGDSRPEQVMFREGLLYIARSVRLADLQINWLGTSTVLYDVLKTCAGVAPIPACGGYSVFGTGLTAPALTFEYEWFNGQSVPDPNGDINGFGFYEPMFESPADVVASGPIAPISTLQLFDKLFVGMTTGGTSNTAGTFSKDFPSLWDFRPGDDAYDTIEPYLDPYSGTVFSIYQCGGDVTVSVLSKSGSTITVADPTGLGVGMFLSGASALTTITGISGNVITLSTAFSGTSFPANATFSRIQPTVTVTATLITAGSNQITVSSATGLLIGQTVGSTTAKTTAFTAAANLTFPIKSITNVGVGEAITGGNNTASATTTLGVTTFTVPNSTQLAVGENVTGPGIAALSVIATAVLNPDLSPTILVTLNNAATASATSTLTFDATPCFGAGKVTLVTNQPAVTTNGTVACTSFVALAVNNSQLNGIDINNGIPVVFTSSGIVSGSIININGTIITLSAVTASPIAGLAGVLTTTNIPLTFTTSGTIAVVTCPIIPFSARGGASTDPNDGSLWLYGEFAKNRLSTIPGPGQWGTSVANYALSFPATDAYNNDNTYFQDVQANGSADSAYFTWIQIAKNLGLAVPAATGPCTINNGNTPIQTPPVSGTPPVAGTSVLSCPYFLPDTVVTRAEMAYWVVKSQMDEAQVSAYLCATGGDPTGTSPNCNGGIPAFDFADIGNITNPFLQPSAANAALGIPGVTTAQLQRYIEVMVRRGYTKGCGGSTSDATFGYCPNSPVTRAQMAVFLIRAKMNNVFPTTLSGLVLASPYGDNFGTFLPPVPYFSDVTAADPTYGPYYIYIQKMRELRITNGTGGATFSPGNSLTRKEIAVFTVRAFFL